jgi:hypothetical protein
MERHGKRRLLAFLLAVLCLVNTGCQSIVLNADLSKATAEDRKTPLDIMVEENKKNAEAAQSDLKNAVSVQKSEDDYKKYDIGGTEAFYILPTGTPLPDMLLDFKVLDLVNGTTTIYAYQALYHHADETGFGGCDAEGKREPYQDVLSVNTSDIKYLVTVLMAYNTKTQQYRVFHLSLRECTAAYQKTEGVETLVVTPTVEESTGLIDGTGAEIRTTSFADSNDFYNIFTQKVNDNCYMIYEDGIAYFYDRSGSPIDTYNVSTMLDEIPIADADKGKYTYNILKVVCDRNRYMYTLVNAEKKTLNLDHDIEESELESNESGSDTYQMLLCNFSMDVGLHTAEDGTVKGYFISDNLNYNKQVAAWKKDDGTTIDLGTRNDLGERDTDALYQVARSKAITAEQAKADENVNKFDTYRYDEEDMNVKLYAKSKDILNRMYSVNPEFFSTNIYKAGAVAYYAYFETTGLENAVNDKEYAKGDTRLLLKYYGDEFLKIESKLESQTLVKEQQTKTVTLKWEVVKSTTDATTGLTTEQSELHYADVQLRENFDKCYKTCFPNDVFASLVDWRKTSGDIAACNDSGVIRYYTNTIGNDTERSTMLWQTASGNSIDGYEFTTDGRARNLYMYRLSKQTSDTAASASKENTAFVMTGDKNLLVVRRSNEKQNDGTEKMVTRNWEISNRYLSFGFEVESSGMELLNQMKVSQLTGETVLSVEDDDAVDNYLDIGIAFGKANTNDIYLAGLTSGIVRYQLGNSAVIGQDANKKDIHASSQISAYPYYGLWMNEPEKGKDTSCMAIGYQTNTYSYDDKDLYRAKLYTVKLADDSATSNMFLSILNKYPALQTAVMESDEKWNKLVAALGIDSDWKKTGKENTKTLRSYYNYLIQNEKNQKEAINLFLKLMNCSDEKKKTYASKTEFVEELKACYYPSDLEDLMVKYINDLYPEAAKNITVSDYEVLKGAENVVDQAAASVTASADESSDEKADENAVDSAENASGLTEEEQAQLKAQQEEQKKQQQEIERRSKIIQNVKQAGGYLENEKTRADWDNKLNEIINNLHGEFDTKEPGTGAQTNTGTQTNS